mmetsp:Transcript_28441/g.71267  ORF Transcript_28441/g.71267 Transcript_28441/m.71267 type:complete len:217 (-) Transcript_28441:44-694(-)
MTAPRASLSSKPRPSPASSVATPAPRPTPTSVPALMPAVFLSSLCAQSFSLTLTAAMAAATAAAAPLGRGGAAAICDVPQWSSSSPSPSPSRSSSLSRTEGGDRDDEDRHPSSLLGKRKGLGLARGLLTSRSGASRRRITSSKSARTLSTSSQRTRWPRKAAWMRVAARPGVTAVVMPRATLNEDEARRRHNRLTTLLRYRRYRDALHARTDGTSP